MIQESAQENYLIPYTPKDIPNLVSFWNFSESGSTFTASEGESYILEAQAGEHNLIKEESAPLGGKAIQINEGQWLNIPRANCSGLDIHGPQGQVTVIAWLRREQTEHKGCEFIAGQWNESNLGRQYGLFLNITVWKQPDQICGHLSHVGGPTPGYKYCMDGPMGKTAVKRDEWVCIAMTYDGIHGAAYLNGLLDYRPGLNPYSMPGGLHNGGLHGSDFTVGAVDRSGEIGNFFTGALAGLAVYNRSLTPAELFALAQL